VIQRDCGSGSIELLSDSMSSNKASVPISGSVPLSRSTVGVRFVEEEWLGFLRFMRKADWLAAGIVVVTAILLALIPARNSDLWLHLASGRALLKGDYQFGKDPFAFTTNGKVWVNNNWLLDTLSYLVYRVGGGSSLIFLKAIAAGLGAILLLLLGRVRRIGWHQVVGAALAILAISPRLTLQPAIVSYLLLALVWYFLQAPSRRSVAPAAIRFWHYWPLFLVMWLWVNLDGWFLLGLLLIAAWAVEQVLVRALGRQGSSPAAYPVYVVLVSVAVCLLNPYHVRAFLPPPEIRVLWESSAYPYEALQLSPLHERFYGTTLAHSVGGIAWIALAIASLAALLLNWRNARGWLMWLLFLGLALLQARAIPFFAIVAGPLFAFNLEDFAERRWGSTFQNDVVLRASFSLRIMTLLLLLAGPALAWAGWLQPKPYEPRGWKVEVDPSLQRAAEQWHGWRQSGKIGADEQCWNSSPDVAHYLAWFGQGEKCFLDSRYALYDEATKSNYAALHAELAAGPTEQTFNDLLQRWKVRYLIIHGDLVTALNLHLYASMKPEELSVVFQDGSTSICYWRGSPSKGSERPLQPPQTPWNPNEQAFRSGLARTVPAEGPARPPRWPDWKDPFVTTPVFSNPDRDEAALMMHCFNNERPRQAQQLQSLWKGGLAAGLTVPCGIGTGGLGAFGDLSVRLALLKIPAAPATGAPSMTPAMALAMQLAEAQVSAMDEADPAWLFLAIRAARRAVHAHPDDDQAWQLLGDAYNLLHQHSAERAEFVRWFDFRQLSNAQIVGAWRQALRLNPNLDSVRLSLANHYRLLDQPELALPLFQELLARQRAAGPGKGETAEQFATRMRGMTESVKSLEQSVDRQRDLFEINSQNLKTEDRCEQAASRGLAQTALDIMLSADPASFGRPGLKMEMELLLLAGRVYDVRDWLIDDYIAVMTELDFRWAKARVYAAIGDYAKADETLQRMAEISLGSSPGKATTIYTRASMQVGGLVLQALQQNQTPLTVLQTQVDRAQAFNTLRDQSQFLAQFAELQVLRGLLALEAGDMERARTCFQTSLRMWGSGEVARTGGGIDFNGRRLSQHYLQMINAWEP
jgi:tetratricopeptide (TPR) repeat protein